MKELLNKNPEERLSAEEALNHSWLANVSLKCNSCPEHRKKGTQASNSILNQN